MQTGAFLYNRHTHHIIVESGNRHHPMMIRHRCFHRNCRQSYPGLIRRNYLGWKALCEVVEMLWAQTL